MIWIILALERLESFEENLLEAAVNGLLIIEIVCFNCKFEELPCIECDLPANSYRWLIACKSLVSFFCK